MSPVRSPPQIQSPYAASPYENPRWQERSPFLSWGERTTERGEDSANSSQFHRGSSLSTVIEGATPATHNSNLRDVRYGNLDLFRPWFPEVDPNHTRASGWRTWSSRRKIVILTALLTTLVVLLINLTFAIYMPIKYNGLKAVMPLYQGDCSWVKYADTGLHVLINVLSTGLLGASSLCMQLLAAPTREEVDEAHRDNQWLDIGVPSWRNLWRIKRPRMVVWWCLALSSIPLHFIYNSVVSSSIPTFSFGAAIVSESFLNKAPWGDPEEFTMLNRYQEGFPPDDIWNRTASLEYMQNRALVSEDVVNITKAECLKIYTDIFSNRTNLLVITEDLPSDQNSSVVLYEYVPAQWSTYPMYWLCDDDSANSTTPDCLDVKKNTPEILDQWTLVDRPVKYCMSERRADDYCRLNYSPYILIAICVTSFFKVMCIAWVAYRYREPTIATLGDAICSFLEKADMYTSHMGIVTKNDFKGKNPSAWHSENPTEWHNKKPRWVALASKRRWIFTIIIFLVVIIISIVQFYYGTRGTMQRGVFPTFASVLSMEFGAPHHTAFTAYSLDHYGAKGFISNVLWANYWQIVISGLYFALNALMTSMLLGREWANYAKERKPLRVSHPRGIQRSSFFISMPFRYGIPLMISNTTLHWLVSRSIFLVSATTFYPNAKENTANSFVTTGYSPKATFIAIIVGTFISIVFIWNSFRKMPGGMPMVASCSAAISAACHRPREDEDSHLLPILWGVVNEPDETYAGEKKPGHCSFTTLRNVRGPKEGELYAGVAPFANY